MNVVFAASSTSTVQKRPHDNTPQGGISEALSFTPESKICIWTFIYFPGVRERSQEQCVRETCEASLLLSLHPRSSLTLILQVLHDDGSVSFRKTHCRVVLFISAGRTSKWFPNGVCFFSASFLPYLFLSFCPAL